jgi:hypothetical protein
VWEGRSLQRPSDVRSTRCRFRNWCKAAMMRSCDCSSRSTSSCTVNARFAYWSSARTASCSSISTLLQIVAPITRVRRARSALRLAQEVPTPSPTVVNRRLHQQSRSMSVIAMFRQQRGDINSGCVRFPRWGKRPRRGTQSRRRDCKDCRVVFQMPEPANQESNPDILRDSRTPHLACSVRTDP